MTNIFSWDTYPGGYSPQNLPGTPQAKYLVKKKSPEQCPSDLCPRNMSVWFFPRDMSKRPMSKEHARSAMLRKYVH